MNKIPLSANDSSNLVTILKKNFINLYRILYELDPREADKFQSLNHHYFDKSQCKSDHCNDEHNHSDKHSHDHQSSHKHGQCDHEEVMKQFYIPEKELTFTMKLLYDLYKDYKFQEVLPEILDDFSKRFENVKQGGIRDNLGWDEQAEQFVLSKVLSEGLTKAIANYIRKEIQKDQRVESKQPMLLATPQSWYEKFPKIKLEFLDPSIIKSIFDKGFAIQKNFVPELGFVSALDNEVKYFYHEGRFESVVTAEENIRNDRMLSFSFTDIDPKTSKTLYHLCRILTAIPFELNLKASIYAQVSEGFQLSYYKEDNGFHGIHYDSSFQEKFDSGKKISALYIFSEKQEKTKPKLTLHKRDSTDVLEEVELEMGTLFLIKSRVVPYSLSNISQGTFILRYWVNGPADHINKTM